MPTKTLPLDQITVDNELNPREGALDQEAVLDYAQAIDDLPPLDVFDLAGKGFTLAAGFHRLAAHRLAGRTEAACIVHEGDREAALEYADLDNLKHGIRLSRREKREVIERYLRRHPERNDVWCAHVCRTTDKTVNAVRVGLEQAGEIETRDTLFGADGIERPRSKPREAKAVEPDERQAGLPDPIEVTHPEPGVTQATVSAGQLGEGLAAVMGADDSKDSEAGTSYCGACGWDMTNEAGTCPNCAKEVAKQPNPPPPPRPAPPPPVVSDPQTTVTITIKPGPEPAARQTWITITEGDALPVTQPALYGSMMEMLAAMLERHFERVEAEQSPEWLEAVNGS